MLPSSAKPARATAVFRNASAGSSFRNSAASRPMAFNACETPFLPSASFNTLLNFTRMPETFSSVPPVRNATSSRALMFSMLEPVASFTSLRASSPSMSCFVKWTAATPAAPSATATVAPALLIAASISFARFSASLAERFMSVSKLPVRASRSTTMLPIVVVMLFLQEVMPAANSP
ncbi:hypothetical protein D3C87_1604290 [compost metagenome]